MLKNLLAKLKALLAKLKTFKLSNYVKLVPWLQYVMPLLALFAILFLNHQGRVAVVPLAGVVGASATLYRWFKELETSPDPTWKKALFLFGYAALLLASFFAGPMPLLAARLAYFGVAFCETGFVYDLIYP